MGNYKELEIHQMSFDLALKAHKLTMLLPKYELYEQGSQLRRSAQSIKDNIAEGFGRRRYKAEYIRFLVFAHSSCDEAVNQLEMINELYFKEIPITDLIQEFNNPGGKINRYIQYVELNWRT